MKTFRHLSLVMLSVLGAFSMTAQDNPLEVSGELYIDHRFRLNGGTWSWNENRLDLQLSKSFQDKARFHSQIWLRSFGFPFLKSSDQLFNKNLTSPYNLDIREAYVEFIGLFTEKLDVRIGRQRIAWGTGDRLNPTDNLNGYDLEDIWDFGRHLGSDAVRATYYLGEYYLEADYIPFFRPASLPASDWGELLSEDPQFAPGFYLAERSDSLSMPANDLREGASYGLKFGGYPGRFNFSASYVYCRDGLPQPYYNKVSPYNVTGGLSLRSYLMFPRQHIFGADLAGSIGSVGIWAEAAVFLPEKELVMTTDLSAYGLGSMDSVILEKKPYFKVVAGFDYTFNGGHYVNVQYLHGFVHERGHGNLDDYFIIEYEKMLFNDKLRIRPATLAVVISDWEAPGENYAVAYVPTLDYLPVPDAEISLGVKVISGEGEGIFAKAFKKDEFVFSVRYKF